MDNKKILFFLLIIFLFAINAVAAVDVNDTVVANDHDDINLIKEADVDTSNSVPKTFTDLNEAINGNDDAEIYLTENYTYNDDVDSGFRYGISINRPITIHGNGILIECGKAIKLFSVFNSSNINNITVHGADIVIKSYAENVTLNNCILSGNLGYMNEGVAYNCKAINCVFKKNAGALFGQAINCTFIGNFNEAIKDGCAINCTFINNRDNAAFNTDVINCTFINNTIVPDNPGDNKGSGVYGGSVVNSIFIGNQAVYGGAIYDCESVVNCTFVNNGADRCGGAINKCKSVVNCTFVNNGADRCGGAVFECNVFNCSFTNCHAVTFGGAAYNCNITDCTFTGNALVSEDSDLCRGGAVYNSTVINSYFVNNYIETEEDNFGGAIYEGIVINCTFVNNTAMNGGAINRCFAVSCKFINNTADYGGAVHDSSLNDCLLENNHAVNDGGAVYGSMNYYLEYWAFRPDLINIRITDCTFNNNIAGKRGGAVYNAEVSESSKFNNNKGLNGNALYNVIFFTCNNNTFTDLKNIINNNDSDIYLHDNYTFDLFNDKLEEGIDINRSVTIHGNGVVIDGAYATRIFNVHADNVIIKDVVFINGWTQTRGGAVFGNCTLINCTFFNNYAKFEGGALYKGVAVNCTFTKNLAISGGAIYNCSATDCTFEDSFAFYGGAAYETKVANCFFVNNFAIDTGGAILRGIVNNCTFVNNVAGNGGGAIINDGYLSTCTYTGTSYIHYSGGNPDNFTGYVFNSIFIGNHGLEGCYGGALMGGNAINCIFENNYLVTTNMIYEDCAINGGATHGVHAVNCTFTNNSVTGIGVNQGGAMFEGSAINCTFKDNRAGYGGAIYHAPAINCTFIHNQAQYEGGAIYEADSQNCIFINNLLGTKLAYNVANTVYNDGKYLTVALRDEYGRPLSKLKVTISLNGNSKTYTTDSNGKVKVATGNLVPKSYAAKVTYKGDKDHGASSTTAKFTVKKATPKLTANAKTFKRSVKTKKYTITLKDNKNKVMKNKWVTLKVNKKTYKVKTNSKGQATFKITNLKKKGKYTATVSYGGDKYYNSKTLKPKITIK